MHVMGCGGARRHQTRLDMVDRTPTLQVLAPVQLEWTRAAVDKPQTRQAECNEQKGVENVNRGH